MEEPLQTLWLLLLSAATLMALVHSALSIEGAAGAVGRWRAPALLVIGVAGLAPALLEVRLRLLGALLCAGLAVGLVCAAVHRWRLRRRALARERETIGVAVERLASEGAALVSLRGRLYGDPASSAPISGKPCLRYRIEVRRAGADAEGELVCLEEGGCPRLVLRDGQGQVALDELIVPRDARASESVVEGDVGAAEMLERPAPGRLLARLARRFDPEPPCEGTLGYRMRELAVLDGLAATVVGRLAQASSGARLSAMEVHLLAAAEPSSREHAREALMHGMAALGSALAAWLWMGLG
jgi:hypothetical protein